MQTLAFYNAVANNGCGKPQFVSEIKNGIKQLKFDTDVIKKICSMKQ
jgi:hypothetical protein